MENKRIIVFVMVILLAFVGYKLVAAKIQENKEKAVLQERYRLSQLQENKDMTDQKKVTDQLNLCLAGAQNNLTSAYSKLGLGNAEAECNKYKNNIEAQTVCMQGFVTVQNQLIARMGQAKNDCYKRYK